MKIDTDALYYPVLRKVKEDPLYDFLSARAVESIVATFISELRGWVYTATHPDEVEYAISFFAKVAIDHHGLAGVLSSSWQVAAVKSLSRAACEARQVRDYFHT